jgi:hypothetical protein
MASRMMAGGISTTGGPGKLLVSNLDFGVSDSGKKDANIVEFSIKFIKYICDKSSRGRIC